MRLPEFLCIGAMRCGTTSLWEMLGQHERTFLPDRKELHFFDNRNGFYDQGIEAYARYFEPAGPDQVPGETTPCYLFFEEACERIHQVLPDARLLVILRDPVARARSHYWYSVRMGYESLSFERALSAEAGRLATCDPDALNRFSYVARGRYVDQLQRFASRFQREQIHVLFLEDLKAQPAEVMRAVFAHLGLELPKAGLFRRAGERNKGVHPRNIKLHWIMQRSRDWTGKSMAPHKRAVRRLRKLVWRFNVAEGTPPLTPALRARLDAEFRESDDALEAWLGRGLPWRSGERKR
jgi:hypothetical protein